MRTRRLRCRRCKELFDIDGGMPEYCPACTQLKEEWKDKVRMLVWQSPGVTAAEVHVLTGVPFAVIMAMIKSGDLLVVPSRPGEEARAIDALHAMRDKQPSVASDKDAPLQVSEDTPLPDAEGDTDTTSDTPDAPDTTLDAAKSDAELIKFHLNNSKGK